MAFPELAARDLLGAGLGEPWVSERAWHVDWRTGADLAELLPESIGMATSGSTGPSRTWQRTRDQLIAEADLLADLLRPYEPEAIVSFAPPRHIFGALVSVLVPARLKVPVWYRSGFFGALPPADHRRWAVMATPWIFSLLMEHMSWVRAKDDVTVLHSTAMLPATAGDFLAAAAPDRARIVEVFGSTETGGIAHRAWTGGNPPWELFGDVSLLSAVDSDAEVPLVIRSPRLASGLASWQTDDLVEPLDDKRFRFTGRRGRLVKVNGRRMNLDVVERLLRAVVSCEDLALVPVHDDMTGEHVELLVVPRPGQDLDFGRVTEALGFRPKRVRMVERIDRTETGKLRHVQLAPGAGR